MKFGNFLFLISIACSIVNMILVIVFVWPEIEKIKEKMEVIHGILAMEKLTSSDFYDYR